MDSSTVVVIGALAAFVGILAFVRMTRAGESADADRPPGSGSEEPSGSVVDPDAGDDEEPGDEVVAVTSEGYALLPDRHAVRLVPPAEAGEGWKVGDTARNVRGEAALAMSWHARDLTGAQIVRGAADEGPWRLEALGRDGEYTAFTFETRDGADAALALFHSRGVIRTLEDEDGRPAPPSAEQFEQARRVFLETEAELELGDPEEDR